MMLAYWCRTHDAQEAILDVQFKYHQYDGGPYGRIGESSRGGVIRKAGYFLIKIFGGARTVLDSRNGEVVGSAIRAGDFKGINHRDYYALAATTSVAIHPGDNFSMHPMLTTIKYLHPNDEVITYLEKLASSRLVRNDPNGEETYCCMYIIPLDHKY